MKITHVHRGLLLGTGPLVDPGFVGRLLIPLHNLTSENYVIEGGKGLIWVEFTKLSPHRKWDKDARRGADYIPFPSDKRDQSVQEYFKKLSIYAEPSSSSIPGEIKTAKQHAENAEKTVKLMRNWAFGGAVALIIALGTLLFQTLDLIQSATQNISYARDVIDNVRKEQTTSDKKIESLEAKIRSLTESLELVNKEKTVSTNKHVIKND